MTCIFMAALVAVALAVLAGVCVAAAALYLLAMTELLKPL